MNTVTNPDSLREPDPLRRGLLLGAGGAALAAALGPAAGETKDPHTGHAAHGGAYAGLAKAANHCTQAGDSCIAHCLISFKEGDTTLAA